MFFKKYIIDCLNTIFGEVGAAIPIDLLKYSSINRRAIIRVPKSHYVKLRSSLTLAGHYENVYCSFVIHKACPLLLGLLGDSRDYKH